MFENRVLRRIFRPNRGVVRGNGRDCPVRIFITRVTKYHSSYHIKKNQINGVDEACGDRRGAHTVLVDKL
jgi:hypothetical protein